MTKKDYIRIVEDLASAQNAVNLPCTCDVSVDSVNDCTRHGEHGQPIVNATIAAVAKAFAYSEARQNPRFDQTRFFAAITKSTGITF